LFAGIFQVLYVGCRWWWWMWFRWTGCLEYIWSDNRSRNLWKDWHAKSTFFPVISSSSRSVEHQLQIDRHHVTCAWCFHCHCLLSFFCDTVTCVRHKTNRNHVVLLSHFVCYPRIMYQYTQCVEKPAIFNDNLHRNFRLLVTGPKGH